MFLLDDTLHVDNFKLGSQSIVGIFLMIMYHKKMVIKSFSTLIYIQKLTTLIYKYVVFFMASLKYGKGTIHVLNVGKV
jgi:hypothetical protein